MILGHVLSTYIPNTSIVKAMHYADYRMVDAHVAWVICYFDVFFQFCQSDFATKIMNHPILWGCCWSLREEVERDWSKFS